MRVSWYATFFLFRAVLFLSVIVLQSPSKSSLESKKREKILSQWMDDSKKLFSIPKVFKYHAEQYLSLLERITDSLENSK